MKNFKVARIDLESLWEHPGNTPGTAREQVPREHSGTPREHRTAYPWIMPGICRAHPGNTTDYVLRERPGSTPAITRERMPWNTLGTRRGTHGPGTPGNTPGTLQEPTGTPREHPGNTSVAPRAHPGHTQDTPRYRRRNSQIPPRYHPGTVR